MTTRDFHLDVIVSEGHKSHATRVLPQGASIAPSPDWQVALWIQCQAVRRTLGGEMLQKRFEHDGATAYEPGVYLKNPTIRHGENKVEN